MMKTYIVAYLATLVAFAAIDFVWLSTMANVLYKPTLGDMMAPNFRLAPAILFYLIYAGALTYFATVPGITGGSVGRAMLQAAIFGFAAYATYDLTNQATLKNWTTTLTVADLIWGSFVSAAGASIATWVTQKITG